MWSFHHHLKAPSLSSKAGLCSSSILPQPYISASSTTPGNSSSGGPPFPKPIANPQQGAAGPSQLYLKPIKLQCTRRAAWIPQVLNLLNFFFQVH